VATVDRRAGRQAFGADPAAYHRARPGYPEALWQALEARCDLRPGCAVFEVGAGSGLATGELLRRGADPLVAIEPDPRMAEHLRRTLAAPALSVVEAAFEDAELAPGRFDLGCSFTAFHWVDAAQGLAKAHRALRPGGAWAMVWHVFGDPARPDAFHDATAELLQGAPLSPSGGSRDRPFALDGPARCADLAAAGFINAAVDRLDWILELDPAGRAVMFE
jgi:SAM-dependent methyltransferase